MHRKREDTINNTDFCFKLKMTLPEKAPVAKFHPWDRCWNVDFGPRKATVFTGDCQVTDRSNGESKAVENGDHEAWHRGFRVEEYSSGPRGHWAIFWQRRSLLLSLSKKTETKSKSLG